MAGGDDSIVRQQAQDTPGMRELPLAAEITAAERTGKDQVAGDQHRRAHRPGCRLHEVAVVFDRVAGRAEGRDAESADFYGLALAQGAALRPAAVGRAVKLAELTLAQHDLQPADVLGLVVRDEDRVEPLN